MIADVRAANGKSERTSHSHPTGVGGRVPPLLAPHTQNEYRAPTERTNAESKDRLAPEPLVLKSNSSMYW